MLWVVEVAGVDTEELAIVLCEVVVGCYGVDRACLHAGPAVDALLRVDVQHRRRPVVRFVRSRVDAVHRTDADAGGIAATGLCHDERHAVHQAPEDLTHDSSARAPPPTPLRSRRSRQSSAITQPLTTIADSGHPRAASSTASRSALGSASGRT